MKLPPISQERENAISPVIGIMLMLVVTIVIAAVVAAFSTGLVDDAEAAPTAVLDVMVDASYVATMGTYPMFELRYVSGDTELDTAKLSFDFVWTNPYADNEDHDLYYDAPRTITTHVDADSMAEFAEGSSSGSLNTIGSCLLYPITNSLWGGTDMTPYKFGNHILTPGQAMVTPTIYMNAESGSWGEPLPFSNEAMIGLFGSADAYFEEYDEWEECVLAEYIEMQLEYDNAAYLHVTIMYDDKYILFDEVVTVS